MKTSGSKGLHLSVPLNDASPAITDDVTKAFALAIGRVLAEAGPDRVTVAMAKRPAAREGVRGLEPERREQDDRRGLLTAAPSGTDGLDPGDLGRGLGRARRR